MVGFPKVGRRSSQRLTCPTELLLGIPDAFFFSCSIFVARLIASKFKPNWLFFRNSIIVYTCNRILYSSYIKSCCPSIVFSLWLGVEELYSWYCMSSDRLVAIWVTSGRIRIYSSNEEEVTVPLQNLVWGRIDESFLRICCLASLVSNRSWLPLLVLLYLTLLPPLQAMFFCQDHYASLRTFIKLNKQEP